jgi:hypothetical protein
MNIPKNLMMKKLNTEKNYSNQLMIFLKVFFQYLNYLDKTKEKPNLKYLTHYELKKGSVLMKKSLKLDSELKLAFNCMDDSKAHTLLFNIFIGKVPQKSAFENWKKILINMDYILKINDH